jgi:hypothetical protein
MGSVYGEGALAHSRHSVDRVDPHHAAVFRHRLHQARQVRFTASEAPDVMREYRRGGSDGVCEWLGPSRWVNGINEATPRGRFELGPGRAHQIERIGQQTRSVLA